jgi:hypothetical protein
MTAVGRMAVKVQALESARRGSVAAREGLRAPELSPTLL